MIMNRDHRLDALISAHYRAVAAYISFVHTHEKVPSERGKTFDQVLQLRQAEVDYAASDLYSYLNRTFP
jgi:hypothetical protein